MKLIQSPSALRLEELTSIHRHERMERHGSVKIREQERLREAATEFEVLFLQQVMKSMRDSGFKSELLRKSEGEKMFQSMLDEQYARLGNQSDGGLGLGKMIYKQYLSNLEG